MNEASTPASDDTPILIGVGQCVDHWDGSDATAAPSPLGLMERAARVALSDTGAATDVLSAIDCIAVVRLFADSPGGMAPEGTGGCDKPPLGLAARLVANPGRAVYSPVGGQCPQALVNEFANAIHAGDHSCVLLAGSEAIAAAKTAIRAGIRLDWNETIQGEMEDRKDDGPAMIDGYEAKNGIGAPIHTYGLFEHALRRRLGRSRDEHLQAMSELWAGFSEVAARNPYAQFPEARSAEYLATPGKDNYRVSDPYLKWHVAQDAVNQGAAVILTSVGKARDLGVPQDKWVYLHGGRDLANKVVSLRPDLSRSPATELAISGALAQAGKTADDMAHFDIYSCFPVAVFTTAEALGVDWRTTQLTQTGGLPFSGGAGNNYSMHGIAAMVETLRGDPGSFGLVLANGGFISKISVGVYSTVPPAGWQPIDSASEKAALKAMDEPERLTEDVEGTVESYTVSYSRGEAKRGCVIAATPKGRVMARPDGDAAAALASLTDVDADPIGRRVVIRHRDGANQFLPLGD